MLVTPRRVHSERRWRRRPAVGHGITCCSDCYDDFQVSGDTGSSCTDNCCSELRCIRSGNETASRLSREQRFLFQFCAICVDASSGGGATPICRADIPMVMRVYSV